MFAVLGMALHVLKAERALAEQVMPPGDDAIPVYLHAMRKPCEELCRVGHRALRDVRQTFTETETVFVLADVVERLARQIPRL